VREGEARLADTSPPVKGGCSFRSRSRERSKKRMKRGRSRRVDSGRG
jgi:hypothetical protein